MTTDEISLRTIHFYDKFNKVHFNFRFLHPHAYRGGSHRAPVNTCGAGMKATLQNPPYPPECLLLDKPDSDGPTLGLLSD